ncbi:MAG: Flp family type IVb pilin [Methylobacterium sp.]|nr:Flp family type IVb pilin [Methylobacterium sp.]
MMGDLLTRMSSAALRSRRDEAGTTSVEYSVIGGLIFLAIAAALQTFSSRMNGLYGVIEAVIVRN